MITLVVAAAITFALIAFSSISRRAALTSFVVWIVLLGLIRRLLPAAPVDPLLLTAPVVVAAQFLLWRRLLEHRRIQFTPLAKWILIAQALLTLEVLNPAQGNGSVALAGLVLVVAPMTLFWIWRVNPQITHHFVRLVIGSGIVAGAYGLWQMFAGLPSWDASWAAQKIANGHTSLYLGDSIRSFSTFTASADYTIWIGASASALIALLLHRGHGSYLLGSLFLAMALWFAGVRSVIVLFVLATGLSYGLFRRWTLTKTVLCGIAMLVIISFSASHFVQPPDSQDGRSKTAGLAASATERNVFGIASPLDSKSTVGVHIQYMVNGFETAITHPLGRGTGAMTHAASKFAGTSGDTEVDISNLSVAAGLFGIIAYCAIVFHAFRSALRNYRRSRSPIALALLAILIVTFGQWFRANNYAEMCLVWMTLGFVDALAAVNPCSLVNADETGGSEDEQLSSGRQYEGIAV